MKIEPPPPRDLLLKAAQTLPTPFYLLDEVRVLENLNVLQDLSCRSEAKVVLAQKAFAVPQLYPLIGQYLAGACASGVWEAQLAKDYFPPQSEILTCAPAYRPADLSSLLRISDHLDFNSLAQWERSQTQCLEYQAREGGVQFGLRVNPEHSTGSHPLYDPCSPGSRLGITRAELERYPIELLDGISGLHFHTLCEQGYEDLESTVRAVESQFGDILERPSIQYLNLGGGHWITKELYDREKLIELLQRLKIKYKVQVYLEPGEAVVLHTGILVGQVLDIVRNGAVMNVIMDLSATAHMPDVLEMPYCPQVYDCTPRKATGEEWRYRLTGNTCLAGDVIGEYSFPYPLSIGDRLCFNDMAHYTMVKSHFFNGVPHPAIMLLSQNGEVQCLKEFQYKDFLGLKQ